MNQQQSSGWPIIVLLATAFVVCAGWGQLMYSDWKCGMPYVQCRKVVP